MSLIKCPECMWRVSTKAQKCPHCGTPMGAILRAGEPADDYDQAPAVESPDAPPAFFTRLTRTTEIPFHAEPRQPDAPPSTPDPEPHTSPRRNELEERMNRQAIRREFVRSEIYIGYDGIVSAVIGTIAGTVGIVILGAIGLLIAEWIGLVGDEYLPREPDDTHISVIFLYLLGPLLGILSGWIHSRVVAIEEAMSRKRLLDYGPERKGAEIDEVISLKNERRDLYWDKSRKLLGAPIASDIALVALSALNWYAIWIAYSVGVQWVFVSKWIAVPVYIVWILGTLLASLQSVCVVWEDVIGLKRRDG